MARIEEFYTQTADGRTARCRRDLDTGVTQVLGWTTVAERQNFDPLDGPPVAKKVKPADRIVEDSVTKADGTTVRVRRNLETGSSQIIP